MVQMQNLLTYLYTAFIIPRFFIEKIYKNTKNCMKNTTIDIKYGTDIRVGSSPAVEWVLLAEGIQYETVRLCQVIPQHHDSFYRV